MTGDIESRVTPFRRWSEVTPRRHEGLPGLSIYERSVRLSTLKGYLGDLRRVLPFLRERASRRPHRTTQLEILGGLLEWCESRGMKGQSLESYTSALTWLDGVFDLSWFADARLTKRFRAALIY